jgi:DNA repair protein RadA/Sms
MSRHRTIHRCQQCGSHAPRWVGRCPACGEWGTLVEELEPASGSGEPGQWGRPSEPATPIVDVPSAAGLSRPTGMSEVDRVLSGGLVPGSVTLLGGEPGIGKSTLLLQLAAAVARSGRRALYASAEESRHQVRARAGRLGALVDDVWLTSDTALPHVVAQLDLVEPSVVVVDSIQTVHDPQLDAAAGSVSQVRQCAHRLVGEAKGRGTAVVLVGHVTKDGGLAGPRVLEHLVDTVLSFEGDRHHALRMLRPLKHRFGSTSELGLFEMTDAGLVGVPDAAGLFLGDRQPGLPGSVVVPALDGHRPLLVEIQGLVAQTSAALPRRSAQGLDPGRLAVLLAVLERRASIQLTSHDVFALAVGGVRVTEPGADLGLALAVASAHLDQAVPGDLVACAELGLGGELRQVSHTTRRLAEAARLGFRRALLPASAPDPPAGVEALRAGTLVDAIARAGLRLPTEGGDERGINTTDRRRRRPAAA